MTLIRAQTGNDVVYLLQGGKLEGEIIENVAGSFIVIRTEKQTKKINYKKKPTNVLRIFAIGSSTVEGMLLGDRVNWPHLLQEKLNST